MDDQLVVKAIEFKSLFDDINKHSIKAGGFAVDFTDTEYYSKYLFNLKIGTLDECKDIANIMNTLNQFNN